MKIDLADIQGLLVRSYTLPFGRFLFLNFTEAAKARDFLSRLAPLITTGVASKTPQARTLNIALTRTALTALELPLGVVKSFPVEFLDGMAKRGDVLGDTGLSDISQWDPIWRERVDVLVAINAFTAEDRDAANAEVTAAMAASGGAVVAGVQEVGALVVNGSFVHTEHFGFADGSSQPDFVGAPASGMAGNGKPSSDGGWKQIEAGEFILGHRNEAAELPAAPVPPVLAKNGSYLVYRKLEENVGAFREYVARTGAAYPGGPEKLMAKMVGRWRDGTPVMNSPDAPDPAMAADMTRYNDFTYADDPEGLRCPVGAHVRRVNPRSGDGFGGLLATRRRLIRRGLPYGPWAPEDQPVDNTERGIIFMGLNASISRQFEFVQQQWINYGNDFHLGEDRDPILGGNREGGRYIIPGDPAKGEEPFICLELPSFVTLKGGDYFFLPSLTALRLLAAGNIDPR